MKLTPKQQQAIRNLNIGVLGGLISGASVWAYSFGLSETKSILISAVLMGVVFVVLYFIFRKSVIRNVK